VREIRTLRSTWRGLETEATTRSSGTLSRKGRNSTGSQGLRAHRASPRPYRCGGGRKRSDGRIETPASRESSRQQQLPDPNATAPALDPTVCLKVLCIDLQAYDPPRNHWLGSGRTQTDVSRQRR
jgi:hypothetical protein